MSLVGDVLFRCRADIPDMPIGVLPNPSVVTGGVTFTVVSASGSTLTPGDYRAVVTERNPWGESSPSGESGVLTVGANQGIQVSVSSLLPGAVAIRAYLTPPGGTAGSELQFIESTNPTFVISSNPTGIAAPPIRSTAYLMDSDGPQFGAATLYSWLNEALVQLSRIVGGIQDYSGVSTVAGQPLYVAPQQWLEISDVWYGGYWMQGGQRNQFFRRNAVLSNVLWGVSISVRSDKQVFEVSPQPDRTSGTTTTSANMGATDTQVAIANTGAFLLPFGFAQIGTEIVAYASLSGGNITGLIRGLGSTVAKTWTAGTTVTELSLFWCGKRIFQPGYYSPGQALSTLYVPNGWEAIIPIYMLSVAAKAQQDYQTAKQLYDQFEADAQKWLMANKAPSRFVQVGGMMAARPLTFDNTVAGGLMVT